MARGIQSRGIVLSSENKGADQLHGHRAADQRLCFGIYAKRLFSHDATQMIFKSAKMCAATLYMGFTRDNSHTYFL